MIIEIPQPNQPFHTDPEWKDWPSFFQWLEAHNANNFMQQLMSEHLLKKRLKAFLEAAISQEKSIQHQLEQLIASESITPDLPKLQIPFRPKLCPNFNDTYGTWEGFGEALVREHKDLRAFHKKLRFSREFRREVVDFLKDAFAFEDEMARKHQNTAVQ